MQKISLGKIFLWKLTMTKLLIDEPPLQVLPSLAVKIGLGEAIIVQQIHYWTQKAKPSDDGHCWVFNSVKEWKKQFPFWSENTIFRHLHSLREAGVLIAEQRASNSFDKTLYYRINYEAIGGESITPNWGNRKHQNDVITIKTETTKDYFSDFWKVYPKKVAKEDAIKAFAKLKMNDDLFNKIIVAIKEQGLANRDKQFVPHAATWLNKKRWEDEITPNVNQNQIFERRVL